MVIEAGADVTANNNFAIRIANLNDYTEIVEMLKGAGAKL